MAKDTIDIRKCDIPQWINPAVNLKDAESLSTHGAPDSTYRLFLLQNKSAQETMESFGDDILGYIGLEGSSRITIPLAISWPNFVAYIIDKALLVWAGNIQMKYMTTSNTRWAKYKMRDFLMAKGLSNRETELAELVCAGMSNADIGIRLFIKEETVKYHMTNIYRKLKVKGRSKLILLCATNGFI